MNKKILEKTNSFHRVYTWSGNFPMLDMANDKGIKFQKEHIRISGDSIMVTANFFENGILTSYRTEEDDTRLLKYYSEKFLSNTKFLQDSVKDYRQQVNNDLKNLREIHNIKQLNLLTNDQLINLFEKGQKHLLYNWTVDIFDWYMELLLVPFLQEWLEKKLKELGKPDMLSEYVNTLITPHDVSIIFTERQRFFEIVKFIRDDINLYSLVKKEKNLGKVLSEHTKLKDLINKYLDDFDWINVYVNNPSSNFESVCDEVLNFVIYDTPLEVKAKRLGDNYDKNIIDLSKKYLKELNPPSHITDLISGLRRMAFLRTEDYVVMSQSSYLLLPLYSEIARRLGITYYELKEFLPHEIVDYLKRDTKVHPSSLKERINLTCFLTFDNEEYLFVGGEAREIKEIIVGSCIPCQFTIMRKGTFHLFSLIVLTVLCGSFLF